MYARVVRWEGADAGALRDLAQQIESRDGPPEGVPATGITYLMDPDSGRALVVTLYASEDDRRQADETFNQMSPPGGDAMGRRASVEMYEVGFEARLE